MTKLSQSQKDELYLKIMRLFAEQPYLSQRELAGKLGISIGATHYCVKALLNKGYVKLENFANSKHKNKYAYVLTPSGLKEKIFLTRRYLEIKKEEYELLRAELEKIDTSFTNKV